MNYYEPVAELIQLTPQHCDKFPHCSANICPLDPEWEYRTYKKGEPVCYYMLEAVKPGAESRLRGTIEGITYQAIGIVIQPMKCRYGPLKNRLERAKQTNSRMGSAT
jgi:hypothetical protein